MRSTFFKITFASCLGFSGLSFGQNTALANNRVYRLASGNEFTFKDGTLSVFLFDGDAFNDVECGALPAGFDATGAPLLPFFPGDLPCPPGSNALVTTQFGDRDQDVTTAWFRLGSVNEATRVPISLPDQIELTSGPITDLPRPLRDFRDRSSTVLFDLQQATFSELDVARYELSREFEVPDVDLNGDGTITEFERESHAAIARNVEVDHLGETISLTGTRNNYLISYPIRPFVEQFFDLDPETAPRESIGVSQFQFVEAYPGISFRTGLTSGRQGFQFDNLENLGTDFDGDPALLVDFRAPGELVWTGNEANVLIPAMDDLFIDVFEERFTADGVPIVDAGEGTIPVITLSLSQADPEIPVVITTAAAHLLDSTEELRLYGTGLSFLDGQSFFASVISEAPGFNPIFSFELFNDEGLSSPVTFGAFPAGQNLEVERLTGGNQTFEGVAIVPTNDPSNTQGIPLLRFAAPHGLDSGDSVQVLDSGFTSFDNQELFVELIGGNDTEVLLFTDALFTSPVDFDAIPNGFFANAVVQSQDNNDFEFAVFPFSFVEIFFGGQQILDNPFMSGFRFPETAFRLFFGTPFGAQAVVRNPGAFTRNDLIARVRFARNIQDSVFVGVPDSTVSGDLSFRDFEVEIVLTDSIEGTLIGLQNAASNPLFFLGQGATPFNADRAGDDDDLDGDGIPNFYEFAFDADGSMTEPVPALASRSDRVRAEVEVTVEADGSTLLSVKKRPGVRETVSYCFEQGVAGDDFSVIETGEGTGWKVLVDDPFVYQIQSTEPLPPSCFFRACATKEMIIVEQ